jgi:hypothetical protein
MFCYKCGKQIPDNSVYCGLCGAKQDESNPVNTADTLLDNDFKPIRKAKPAKRLGHGMRIFGLLILIAVLSAAGYFGFQWYKSYISAQIEKQKIEIKTATTTVLLSMAASDKSSSEIYMTETMKTNFDLLTRNFTTMFLDKLQQAASILDGLLSGSDQSNEQARTPTVEITEFQLNSINETEIKVSGILNFEIALFNRTIGINFTSKLIR